MPEAPPMGGGPMAGFMMDGQPHMGIRPPGKPLPTSCLRPYAIQQMAAVFSTVPY